MRRRKTGPLRAGERGEVGTVAKAGRRGAVWRAGMACAAALALSGCQGTSLQGVFGGGALEAGELPDSVPPYPDDQVLAVAKAQFRDENYGNAARYFERATQVDPDNGEAWLGLAASYDRLRRFDLADDAYRAAERRLGARPEYLNNVGYSYLLRGDLDRAEVYFNRALRKAPDNPTILNNLQLVRSARERP